MRPARRAAFGLRQAGSAAAIPITRARAAAGFPTPRRRAIVANLLATAAIGRFRAAEDSLPRRAITDAAVRLTAGLGVTSTCGLAHTPPRATRATAPVDPLGRPLRSIVAPSVSA